MRRILLLFLFIPMTALAQSEPEQRLVRVENVGSGSLLVHTQYRDLFIESVGVGTEVSIGVTGMVSRAKVIQRFLNEFDSCVDATYVFPLPDGAAVDAYRMRVGGRVIEGEIHEKEEARQIYEEARSEGRRASIVERHRPNVFSISLSNIGPRESIEVEIELQSVVAYNDGVFELRFPTVVAPRYESAKAGSAPAAQDSRMPDISHDLDRTQNPFSLSVDLDAGFPLQAVSSPSHEIDSSLLSGTRHLVTLREQELPADRDFVLRWTPTLGREPRAARFSESSPDGSETTMLMVLPPDSGVSARIPKEVIFIIDTSGSMSGSSMEQAKAALTDAIARLRSIDSFEIIEFNSSTHSMFGRLKPVNEATLEHAGEWVDSLGANGGTEMKGALAVALGHPELNPTAVRQVVFITDGQVGNEADLFRFVTSRLGGSRIFTIGIGSAPNSNLMSLIAKAGRGTYTFVSSTADVKSTMTALFRKLESPVLTGIAIRSDDPTAEFLPDPLPDLYAGEPLIVTVRTKRSSPRLFVASEAGSLWRDDISKSTSREMSGVSRLFAQRKVEALEESITLGAPEDEVRPEIVGLAIAGHLVTKYTSFVAVDRAGPIESETCVSVPVKVNLPDGWGGIERATLPQTATSAPFTALLGVLLIGVATVLFVVARCGRTL